MLKHVLHGCQIANKDQTQCIAYLQLKVMFNLQHVVMATYLFAESDLTSLRLVQVTAWCKATTPQRVLLSSKTACLETTQTRRAMCPC